MKHTFKLLFLLFSLFTLWSCEKDENKVYYEGGTAPALSSSVSGNIPLSFANADKEAIRLSWTNPDYQFTTGVSSQDVSYVLEIDTTGANFTSPIKQSIAIKNNLTQTFTQGKLNEYLLNALLRTGMQHNIEMRVISTLGINSVPLISNVLKFTVTPYAIPPVVEPPASGKLFITGGATPAGWMAGGDPELANQKFNQITPTLYELPSIALKAGESYLFVPVYGNWDNKYGGVGSNNSNNPDGGDFKAGGGDLKAPAANGNYKITVNFQTGKFSVTKI